MASEIERLIHRVQETETARKNLLEELSHDLRTPLTSLNTSVETLTDHWDEMPSGEQKEFVQVVRTELRYFLHLIEDLFFIASIGEPRYKSATKRIDLNDLLKNELKGREKRAGSTSGIKWELQCDEAANSEAFVLGDPLLIQRLFKNALDNAARHAASVVQVHLMPSKGAVEVRIENDGRTISDEEIESFGKRRKNRFQVADSSHEVSLGLGSVIMQAITELHGGSISIMRKESERGAGGQGTVLSLRLPKNLAQSDENTAK
jgi:K+-sensing histidine kinase KdpD